ncbi:MAG: homoserine dehydrogenase [Clostridia bacterium]|nr:homoserine dehydrogenase [Clostridia bacterium]
MKHIAILGFGVVGGGVASLLQNNKKEIEALLGEEVSVDYILDLREFPDSPYANRVVHDFNIILNSDVDTVIEAMGGSHPAYEYTVAALKARKNVITSNKEVVSLYLDEFLMLAEENDVVYRFEASVGGGIPVISPLISLLRHNKIREVRGILNGTTNYILTKMFSFGESFEHALADAQRRGYAERIPDADVLGTDAARKISILASLVHGSLVDVNTIYTEGITKIRGEDIARLSACHHSVKLVGRALFGEEMTVFVSPHAVPHNCPLSHVDGVYNAIEVVGEPVGNVMFYGQGAGAGATASAMVSDLMVTYLEGRCYAIPRVRDKAVPASFRELPSRFYIVIKQGTMSDAPNTFMKIEETENEVAYFTDYITLDALQELTKHAEMLTILPILE